MTVNVWQSTPPPSPVIVQHYALPPVPLERLYERVANLHAACVEEFGADSPEARQTGLQADALRRLVTLVDKQAAEL